MPSRKPTIANDNETNAPPRRRWAWDIYVAAARGRWVGRVVAPNAVTAVKAAAVEFKADSRKLIPVRRFEIE
jgi:hypothetical protein